MQIVHLAATQELIRENAATKASIQHLEAELSDLQNEMMALRAMLETSGSSSED